MATTVIALGAEAARVNGNSRWEFQTSFNPPPNVSGKTCYLKLVNIGIEVSGNKALPNHRVYYLTLNLPQPFGFSNINNPAPSPGVFPPLTNTTFYKQYDSKNQVIGLVNTGDHQHANWQQGSFPRCLVEVPDGPQYLTISLWPATTVALGDDLDQLSIVCELTPVEDKDDRHLMA